MSVLLSRSVALSRPFSVPGCGHAVVTVLSSLLTLCRLRWENFSRRGAVKWGRVSASRRRRLSSALRGDRSVLVAAGEYGPCDARQLIGHGDYNNVFRRSGVECIEPGSDRCSVALDPQYRSSCTMDQDLAKVSVQFCSPSAILRVEGVDSSC